MIVSIGRAEHLHAERRKLVLELDTDVERRLSAKGNVDPVRLLVLDDLAHKLGRHGQKVDFVGEPFGRCDRRDVWVDEDRVDAFFLERFDRLRARIVEFARLADGETSRAEYEYLLDIGARRACVIVGFLAAGKGYGHESPQRRSQRRSGRTRQRETPYRAGPGVDSGWNCTEKNGLSSQ
jgi:hypothetical protein